MKVVWRCEEHNVEFSTREEAERHQWEFHTPFKKPCLLNGKPYIGLCIDKEQYERCQNPPTGRPKIRNNWMCWRDGILHSEMKKKEVKKK